MSSAQAEELFSSELNKAKVLSISLKLPKIFKRLFVLKMLFNLVLGVNAISIFLSSWMAKSHMGLLICFSGTPKASGYTH